MSASLVCENQSHRLYNIRGCSHSLNLPTISSPIIVIPNMEQIFSNFCVRLRIKCNVKLHCFSYDNLL